MLVVVGHGALSVAELALDLTLQGGENSWNLGDKLHVLGKRAWKQAAQPKF